MLSKDYRIRNSDAHSYFDGKPALLEDELIGLDAEAARLGINRQAVIKTWVAEKLDAKALA